MSDERLTILESEFREAWTATAGADGQRPYRALLGHLGITVVPDPEPTNAEELTWALMRVVEKHGRGITVESQSDAKAVAELLDADGVKATGDDDE